MTTQHVDYSDYRACAELGAGNWQRFDSFAWHSPPDDAEQFALVYTSNRDSDILDKANAQAIDAELAPYIESGDVIPQTHSHWAVGYVEGYAIRVYDESGEVAAVFRAWCDIQARLEDYPVLDESLYSELETEAQDEAWECWARREFVRGVESALDVELDESDASAILSAFESARERANVYWEGDHIDVSRVVDAVKFDDVRALIIPVRLTVFQDGFYFVCGSITGDEFACDLPLYDDEFGACVLAHDNGAESVKLGNHVYTWRVE